MINLILGLFSNPFFDLLKKPVFWIALGIAVVMGFLIFICVKYPKGGLPVLGVVFALGLVVFDAYCIIQLNLYYNSEGGIHGVLTGIFDTNKVDIVDNLTFEITNEIPKDARIINMKRFIDSDYVARNKREYNSLIKVRNSILNLALDEFERIKKCHFELENIYGLAMNFDKKEQFCNEFCNKILQRN